MCTYVQVLVETRQKKVSDPLDLEIHTAVSCPVDAAGNRA